VCDGTGGAHRRSLVSCRWSTRSSAASPSGICAASGRVTRSSPRRWCTKPICASRRVAALDAALGQHDEARRQLDALQRDPGTLTPVSPATVYLQLGDREQALEILERAIAARDPDLPSAKTEPGLSGSGPTCASRPSCGA